jgi:hypothetical protein
MKETVYKMGKKSNDILHRDNSVDKWSKEITMTNL